MKKAYNVNENAPYPRPPAPPAPPKVDAEKERMVELMQLLEKHMTLKLEKKGGPAYYQGSPRIEAEILFDGVVIAGATVYLD
jgi:hypothetical protein